MPTALFPAAHELAATAARRWFLDRQAAFWLDELGLRPGRALARVVEVIPETQDTRTFVLAPDRRWPGHRAGQFVPVEVEVDGVRTRRCYSISSGASRPGARRIAITVKRVPGGKVSGWMHDRVRPGDRIGLGAPAGEFVISEAGPLLFIAGGSGITPIMAMLRDLEVRGLLADVVVIRFGAIFARELAAMARQHATLRVVEPPARLDVASLCALVPDLAARAIYVCGPPGLIHVAAEAGGPAVKSERFVAAPRRAPQTIGRSVTVQLRGRTVTLAGTAPLLDELERAGERPAHGCRMGICNTCRCTKRSGTVEDLATGAVSTAADEEIRLCVSIARSDLDLAL